MVLCDDYSGLSPGLLRNPPCRVTLDAVIRHRAAEGDTARQIALALDAPIDIVRAAIGRPASTEAVSASRAVAVIEEWMSDLARRGIWLALEAWPERPPGNH